MRRFGFQPTGRERELRGFPFHQGTYPLRLFRVATIKTCAKWLTETSQNNIKNSKIKSTNSCAQFNLCSL